MGKNKLQHFEENKSFPHFFQPVFEEFRDGYFLKGCWNNSFFKNKSPLVLELGCGKGEYTVGLARKYPLNNYIGIDKKGARMWRGAKDTQLENITNSAFLRIKVEQISFCFDQAEVDEIWITFPDPVPKKRNIRKRLTSPNFLQMYQQVLKPGGLIHVKTDSKEFFNYTLEMVHAFGGEVVYETNDLYHSDFHGDASQIQTYYEAKYVSNGLRINYIQFKVNR